MDKQDDTKRKSLSEKAMKPEDKEGMSRVNLLEVAQAEAPDPLLEVVRLGGNETAIIFFTAESVAVDVHYCSETEINGYVICNGPDCVLCRIGRKRDERLLVPVYLPAAGSVGILPVSRSLRPHALLPQIYNVLKSKKPMAAFITRDGAKYSVSTVEIQPDIDAGEIVIKRFLDDNIAGRHDLSAVFPRIDNEKLACVEEIGRMMALKGVQNNASCKRS